MGFEVNRPKRLIVMAGGTGGHIFSGLAVALHLMKKNWKVRWLGTSDRLEADLVPKYGIKIDFIHISSFRNKGIKALLTTFFHMFKAWYQAFIFIKRFKPDVVLGMGGYISGPGGLAAWLLGIPLVLHEQNSVAGLANKWLSKFASKVMQAFPGAFSEAEVVGNPVRADILTLQKPEDRFSRRTGPIRILVIGGSQGASIFNQNMPKVIEKLGNSAIVWHQSGRGSQKIVEKAYAEIRQSQYNVVEFIDDMVTAYAWADIVVCRSGALTVSEISIVGLPALFVPFQHKDCQQYWNALPLVKAGAAKIVDQSNFTVDIVFSILNGLSRATLKKMACRAHTLAVFNATERVAQELNSLIKL